MLISCQYVTQAIKVTNIIILATNLLSQDVQSCHGKNQTIYEQFRVMDSTSKLVHWSKRDTIFSILLTIANDNLNQWHFCFFVVVVVFLVPPQFTEVPKQLLTVKESTVASVTCRAFGSPAPVIQWSKAFASLPKRRATVVNGTLKITSFSLKDVGTYQCKATNKLGSISSSTTLSIVKGEKERFV